MDTGARVTRHTLDLVGAFCQLRPPKTACGLSETQAEKISEQVPDHFSRVQELPFGDRS